MKAIATLLPLALVLCTVEGAGRADTPSSTLRLESVIDSDSGDAIVAELEKRIAVAQAAESTPTQLVRNRVTEEEIAEVVSKWTGIPVSKMLEGEKEKLLKMDFASLATNREVVMAEWQKRYGTKVPPKQ